MELLSGFAEIMQAGREALLHDDDKAITCISHKLSHFEFHEKIQFWQTSNRQAQASMTWEAF